MGRSLKQEISRLEKGLTVLCTVVKLYPKTKFHQDKWGKERLHTVDVNSMVTDCEVKCISGWGSYYQVGVWPYLVEEGTKVYSDPLPFIIGDDCGGGFVEHAGWEEKLKKCGINAALVPLVQKFLDDGADCFDDEEDEGGYGE